MSSVTAATASGAEVVARQLESYGVEVIFGICGHTNIALLDALSRSSIEFVTARHEQAAAHMADGYARVTGRPGVVLVHVGPGMMNAVTGVATAALDSIPLVVIAGDIPSYYHGRHPHQEVNLHADADQWEIYRPFTRRAWRVDRVEDLPRLVERAFWTARQGRGGAVLVDVPMDLFSRPIDPGLATRYPLPARALPPALGPGAAEEIVERLGRARRPLIFVGGGVRRAGAGALVARLAERLGIPIAHSLMGKGAVPDDHPLVIGMPGFWGTEHANEYVRGADVVLALATRFAETDFSSWDERFSWAVPGTELLHVDIDPAEIGRSYPVALGAIADVAVAARQLVEAAEAGPNRDWADLAERVRAARDEVWARMAARGGSLDFPLKPERILEDVRAVVPADTVLVTDVGWNKNGVAQSYRLPAEGLFLTPGGLSTMGFGPAAAIGVKYAARDRAVVAMIGDGAMASQLPALPTAVEQGLAVVWVVMNNSAFGTIADLEQSHFGVQYGTVFRDPSGAPYTPDFAQLARSCGAWGERVESAEQLRPLLRKALAAGVPALVDVPMVNDPVPTPGHWNINDIYRGRF